MTDLARTPAKVLLSLSSVIRQRANLKTGVSRKQSTPKKTNTRTCVCQGVRNIRFSENLA